MPTDSTRPPDARVPEHLHALRRALNGVLLQLEVARLAAPEAAPLLETALGRIRDEARKASAEVEALERTLLEVP